MAHSLRLGRHIELLGGGQASEIQQCLGVIFRLGTQYDFGSAQPVVDFQVALMGDGTRPVGDRYDNRTFVLPVVIQVPSSGSSAAAQAADRLLMVGAREAIEQVISAPQWELTWSPDQQNDTMNTVFECWRAKATTVAWDVKKDQSRLCELQIEFEAMPFGRSDAIEQLLFENAISGNAIPPSPVTIDDFSSVSSSQNNSLWSRVTVAATGSWSAKWDHNASNKRTPMWYAHTISATDLSGVTKVTFWLGGAADNALAYREWHIGRVNMTVTLTDNLGRSITMSGITTLRAGAHVGFPIWKLCSLHIPQGKTFNYNNVTSYQIKVWNEKHKDGTIEFNSTGYLSGLFGEPTTHPKRPASDRGGVYVINGTKGTAPALLNLHAQLTVQDYVATTKTIALTGTPGQPQTYLSPGDNSNFLSQDTQNADKGSIGTWTTNDGLATNATITTSSAQFHSSPNSIRFNPITGGSDMVIASCSSTNVDTQGVPCIAGEYVQCRVWARAATTARTITLSAEFFNSSKVSLGSVSANSGSDSNSAWTLFSGKALAPANSAYARMLVKAGTPALGDGTFLDDNFFSYAVQATVICQGASGASGSAAPSYCGGGGSGGGEIAWEDKLALNSATTHSYTIGAGGTPSLAGSKGGDGGDTAFAGQLTTVTAHGGKGGNNSVTTDKVLATGGAGGTGSANAHHFNGGAGGQGVFINGLSQAGGGGGSAGDGGAGSAGSQSGGGNGGAAGALNIPGAHGSNGAHGGGSGRGAAGSPFGGGVGGSCTQATGNQLGQYGVPGQIKLVIKTYAAISLFSGLILHQLPAHVASAELSSPVISVGSGQDTPDGSIEYAAPDVENLNARYNGTYSVMLCAFTANGAGARTWTVTIRHYEATGGAVSSVSVSKSVDPASLNNLMVNLGEVSLPLKDMPEDNIDSYFTVTVTSSNTADRFNDVLLLDTRGQLAWVDLSGSGYSDYYYDAPDRAGGAERLLGTMTDRTASVSVLANAITTGGAFRLIPGTNFLMVYSPAGQPALEADYYPRYWHERIET